MNRYRFDESTKNALENLNIPLAVYQFIDKRVVTVLLSKGFLDLFGFDSREEAVYLMDHDMYKATHPDDRARIADKAYRFASKGEKFDVIYRTLTKKSRQYIIIHSIGERIITKNGAVLQYVTYTREGIYDENENENKTPINVSIEKSLREKSLINASYYDFLTGLPSMSYFFELVDEWRKSEENTGSTAFLYMDLCGMKYYNRKYGFSEGDKLLIGFADILKKEFSNENCSRFGSDHFCVFTSDENIEERLNRVFNDLQTLDLKAEIHVRAGIYIDEGSIIDISADCDKAKYACDSLKNCFVSKFCYFNDEMFSTSEKEQYIINNLDRAIKEKHIKVYYQPIIRAANGRVCDEEALARWIDPERGIMTPLEFIPVLEKANLIYKLDLFMVEQAIEKIKNQENAGLYMVPQSINLSRSDFDSCDIVEEIRKRVEESGIGPDKINIEITESTVGTNMEFIKSQIERLQSLGFKVWLDDFGSGYSTLDVLQSIRFDLIKFDMRFMQTFYKNDKTRIMLTELIRMAIALDIDTVCEGVETKEQKDFLQEIGCTKLQGFYFCGPIPFERILERYEKRTQIGFENPDESEYYSAVGKINLYDLAIISSEDKESLGNYFNTVPMAIIESDDTFCYLLRCNSTFRTFLRKTAKLSITGMKISYANNNLRLGRNVINGIRECAENSSTLLVDESLPDGSVVHTYIKCIAENPVTKKKAIAMAVLDITAQNDSPVTFTDIARALAADYLSLYYVNLSTENFTEYSSLSYSDNLITERNGNNYFDTAMKEAPIRVHPDDVPLIYDKFKKENILHDIHEKGVFTLNYRRVINNVPVHVNLKAAPMKSDKNHIIIGITDIDSHVQYEKTLERINREKDSYARISALTSDFICIYTVDPESEDYLEYGTAEEYEMITPAHEGHNFFSSILNRVDRLIYPKDQDYFIQAWSKEKMLDSISRNGVYLMYYRLMLDNEPVPVCLKAVIRNEESGPHLIIGVINTNDSHNENADDDESEASVK